MLKPGVTDEVLSYWFGDDVSYDQAPSIVEKINSVWFAGSDDVDNEIRERSKILARSRWSKAI